MNRKNLIFQIYIYLVCYSALIALVFSGILSIYFIIRISAPEFTMHGYQWKSLQSFELYKKDYLSRLGNQSKEISDEELRNLYQQEKELAVKVERREGTKDLITSLLFCFFSLIIFILHWRLGKKEIRESN